MVATHQNDLDAAAHYGLQTAFIERVAEFGPDAPRVLSGSANNTLHARDFMDLANQLGCSS